jgi:2-polyprenyl-3-methyl-5-hydroxy-6-metoxy-1,4-benzoquinol methylase
MSIPACPACGEHGAEAFCAVERVPVHSVLLLETREEALEYPKGDIRLAWCPACGFIWNHAFDARVHEYSARYEETQGFSPTFNAFHKALAERLIERYDLRGKEIVEIGCGKGEFITLISELGQNRGIGIDPAYVEERSLAGRSERVRFITDFYSEAYAHLTGDFVICKMTLEHIPDVASFVGTVRRTVDARPDTTVFFQIPNMVRILDDVGFWDVYYEHCSYFTPGSLARLFRRCGFDVVDLWLEYDDQYLMIEARPGDGAGGRRFPELEEDGDRVAAGVRRYRDALPATLARWRADLRALHAEGKRTVLWGSGSKGVAFLTTMQIWDEIEYTVDINPHKHGMYMAGTGQRIVSPAFLREYRPDVVVIMNPVYRPEIARELERLGVSAEVRTV